jgi:hypothetical protein
MLYHVSHLREKKKECIFNIYLIFSLNFGGAQSGILFRKRRVPYAIFIVSGDVIPFPADW